ncbi:hypothetical protein BEWA_006880 [Theileria equi strain WA]|uniref:Uncharacterized protein n=1 Tax=Theileria equi strain WA TaxID=1537102 RepID=L0B2C7_THEEQ|nr:hypothetical protein BEWA_006880 [Theileria equi strain WA]AFZ81279.1 hypothetical protein BEWA_006880 [Theileria equi strain WA]|eukprot:XP_004830945.1 hypothetical protein BEWA_006880 [Theileria equi strain WA]
MNIKIDISARKNYYLMLENDINAVVIVRKYDFGTHYLRYSHELSLEDCCISKLVHGNIEQFLQEYNIKNVRELSAYYWKEDYKLRKPLVITVTGQTNNSVTFKRKKGSCSWTNSPESISVNILNEQNTLINGIIHLDISKGSSDEHITTNCKSKDIQVDYNISTYILDLAPSIITYNGKMINIFPLHIDNIVKLSVYSLSGDNRDDKLLINVVQKNKCKGSDYSFWFENSGQGERNTQWRYLKGEDAPYNVITLKTKLRILNDKIKAPGVTA